MSKKWPGGIITPTPATPSGPYETGSAPGIWTLSQQSYWAKQGLWPIAGNLAPYGFYGGGDGGYTSVISRINIVTNGSSSNFGELAVGNRAYMASCSSSTRGVFVAGAPNGSGTLVQDMNYLTLATGGSTSTFGNYGVNIFDLAGCGNSTRGVIADGNQTNGSNNQSSTARYITIASVGNATVFGGLNFASYQLAACSSTTRGIFTGGYTTGGPTNLIDYITIATTGSGTNFGNLTVARYNLGGCSNATRGLFMGGSSGSLTNRIDYITIATTGNATTFGDLVYAYSPTVSCSSSTLAISCRTRLVQTNVIATTGNSVEYGNLLSISSSGSTACSNTHGGL